jgi:hypothetical protein
LEKNEFGKGANEKRKKFLVLAVNEGLREWA